MDIEDLDESKVQTEIDNADDDQDSFADGVADTVYVEGLPYDTSEDLIRSFFKDCGKIISIRAPKYQDTGRLRSEIVLCVIPYILVCLYKLSNLKSLADTRPCHYRGYAHIQFAKGKTKSVEQALAKDGQYFNFRYLSIKRANAPKESTQVAAAPTTADATCSTVFVKNLPYNVKEDDVRSAFAEFGKIASVRLAMW